MKPNLSLLFMVFITIGTLTCTATSEENPESIVIKNNNNKGKKFIKVALLLDTSNSMDGLIDQAKAQLWEIVNELSYAKCYDDKPHLQIAIYEYGNDNLDDYNGYIRKVIGFSSDLDEISKELFSLTTNGGNEYCGQAIQTSIDQLDWGNEKNDLKLIFIAGNEPFSQGKINYQQASENANRNNITVNTIFCGDYQQGISTLWKDGADIGQGDYMAINHNKATVHIPSPYDDLILELNIKLNKTYVAYGNSGKRKIALQVEQDSNAEDYSKANAVSRTVSKSSHLYKNSSWDLVDASKTKNFNYTELKKEELPDDLKNKSIQEIKQHIAEKRKERERIQRKIQELNIKRKEFLKSHNQSNELESAMISAIKAQAKKKNYIW